MAHHKKRKPPQCRAGCSLCKPYKKRGRNGKWAQTRQELKARLRERAQRRELWR